MTYAQKKTFRKAAHEVIDIIDKCLFEGRTRCLCVDKAETLLKRLVKELTIGERKS